MQNKNRPVLERKAVEETNRCSESTKAVFYCFAECRDIIKR